MLFIQGTSREICIIYANNFSSCQDSITSNMLLIAMGSVDCQITNTSQCTHSLKFFFVHRATEPHDPLPSRLPNTCSRSPWGRSPPRRGTTRGGGSSDRRGGTSRRRRRGRVQVAGIRCSAWPLNRTCMQLTLTVLL